ncbi:hypothetical protein CSC14_2657 [Proteus mirabilis]|nr:hypothetical protein CSC14_2657 [Proteus mirabilis]
MIFFGLQNISNEKQSITVINISMINYLKNKNRISLTTIFYSAYKIK